MGLVAIAQMAAGDGVADLVGRYKSNDNDNNKHGSDLTLQMSCLQ